MWRRGQGEILGEIFALRSLWLEDDIDGVPGGEATVTPPSWAEHEAATFVEGFDDTTYAYPVDSAVEVVLGLVAPDLIRIERDRHEHAARTITDQCRGEFLWSSHRSIIAPIGWLGIEARSAATTLAANVMPFGAGSNGISRVSFGRAVWVLCRG